MQRISSFWNFLIPDSRIIVKKAAADQARTVLVLGWGGCKPHSIQKVVDFYAEKSSVHCLAFIMPLGIPHFARLALLRPIILELQKLKQQGSNSVSVHAFSNNGTWSYATLAATIERESLREQVPRFDRLVLDSGPQLFHHDIGMHEEVRIFARVLTSVALGKPVYHHHVVTPVIKTALYLTAVFHRFVRFLQRFVPLNIVPPYLEMNEYLRDRAPVIPTMFMFSKVSDDLSNL